MDGDHATPRDSAGEGGDRERTRERLAQRLRLNALDQRAERQRQRERRQGDVARRLREDVRPRRPRIGSVEAADGKPTRTGGHEEQQQ